MDILETVWRAPSILCVVFQRGLHGLKDFAALEEIARKGIVKYWAARASVAIGKPERGGGPGRLRADHSCGRGATGLSRHFRPRTNLSATRRHAEAIDKAMNEVRKLLPGCLLIPRRERFL